MKKSVKSKKGMTLVEIIAVIAIIVILASVGYYGYIHIFKGLHTSISLNRLQMTALIKINT